MKKFLHILFLALSAVSCVQDAKKQVPPEIVVAKDTVYPLGFCTDSFRVVSGEIKAGENFMAWVTRAGLSREKALCLAQVCDSVFDVRKMRAGAGWKAYFKDSTQLRYLVYDNSRIRQTIFCCGDSLWVRRYDKPVRTVEKKADVTIRSSLWSDMTAAGASPELISMLSDIYAWTVDFFGLQKGDRFRILYSEDFCEGESVGVGRIRYAEFIRDTTCLPAIWLDQGDGGNAYWNAKGESLRKAFLKAPLKFTRISSGFSYHRRHPVHGVVRPHTGVDYAAPTGTPVMSVGDGTVVSAGWGGGGGKTVKIRHNSVYTTAYLHLSRFAVSAGQRVSQGQVIGYVGRTGTATGPHLDFRVWKNGTPIDPLKMESPPAEPIAPEYLPLLQMRSKELHALFGDEADVVGRSGD